MIFQPVPNHNGVLDWGFLGKSFDTYKENLEDVGNFAENFKKAKSENGILGGIKSIPSTASQRTKSIFNTARSYELTEAQRNLFDEYNAAIERGEDFNNVIGKGDAIQQKYFKGLNGGKAVLADYTKAMGVATKSTIGLSLASAALNIGVMVAISLAIQGIISLYTHLTQVTERAKEAQEKYNAVFDDIDGAKSELEDIDKKIDEINSKGGLSVIEQAEVDKLENEQTLLKEQISLLEKKAELEGEASNVENKKAAKSSLKGFGFHLPKNAEDWKRFGNTVSGFAAASTVAGALTAGPAGVVPGLVIGTIVGTAKALTSTDEERVKNYTNDIANYKKQLESGDLDADSFAKVKDTMIQRQKELLEIKEDNIALLSGITGTDQDSEEARKKLEEQNDIINKSLYGDGTAEYKANKFDEFLTRRPELLAAYQDLEKDGKVTEDEVRSLAEKFGELSQFMAESGFSAKDLASSLNEVKKNLKVTEDGATSLGSALNTLKEDYSLYNEIASAYASNLTLSNEDLSKIAAKYSDLSDEVYEYTMGLRDAKSLIQALYEKTDKSKLMSSSAFKNMYLATQDVTENIKESFVNAFTLVEYDYDNTKSVMENINASIRDATGTVTENFKVQWKSACQSAGADVQSFAVGYSSIMLGDWYNGTKGVYKSENKGFYYKDGTGMDGKGTNLTNVVANELMEKYPTLDSMQAYKKAYEMLDKMFADSKNRQKDLAKEQAEYEQKLRENEIKDAKKQIANAEKEANKKLKDHDKTDHLESLKEDIAEHQKLLDAYEKQLEVLNWGNELFSEKDYTEKISLYGEKLNTLSEYTKEVRAEMERLLTIEPKTGDEAVEIANQFEALGSKLRENASNIRTLNSELMTIKLDAISASSSSFFEQTDKQIELIDKRLGLLESKNPNANKFSSDVISPDMLFADLSDFKDPIKKKKKETKELVKEEQSRQNKINKIVSDAVKRQNADNKKERDKERAEIIKELGDLTNQIVAKVGLTSEEIKNTSANTTQAIVDDLEKVNQAIQTTIENYGKLRTAYDGESPEKYNGKAPSTIGSPFGTSQVKGYAVLTSRFGVKRDGVGATKSHTGTDIAVPKGTTLYAPADGIIKTIKMNDKTFGTYIDFDIGDDTIVRYAHLSNIYSDAHRALRAGDKVTRGKIVGYSGGVPGEYGSGTSTGAHLHVGVQKNGKWVNWEDYVDIKDWRANLGLEKATGTPLGNAKAPSVGIAGENYKSEILVDKQTGKMTHINEPTPIDLSKTDVIGEKQTQDIFRNRAFANGTDYFKKLFTDTKSSDKLFEQLEDYNKTAYNSINRWLTSEVYKVYSDSSLSNERKSSLISKIKTQFYDGFDNQIGYGQLARDAYQNILNAYEAWKALVENGSIEYTQEAYDKFVELLDNYYNKIVEVDEYANDLFDKKIAQIDNLKSALDSLFSLRIDKYESLHSLLSKHYDLVNSLSSEQHDLNKELIEAETIGARMSEYEKQTLFTKEEHKKLSQKINSILLDANNIQKEYTQAIENATEETIDEITNQYERQYELKQKEYNIVKAELSLAKAQKELENVKNEKSVRVWNGSRWVYDAAVQDVIDAENNVEDAKYDLFKAQTEQTQQVALNALSSQSDALQTQQNKLANALKEMSGETADARVQLVNALESIANVDLPMFSNIIDTIGGKLLNVLGVDGQQIIKIRNTAQYGYESYQSAIEQMQKNSEAWFAASASDKKSLADANSKIGEALGLTRGSDGVWRDKKGNKAYKNGKRNTPNGIAQFDEEGLGSEVIIDGKGVFRQFNAGDTVFSKDMVDKLWNLSNSDAYIPNLMPEMKVPDTTQFINNDTKQDNRSYSVNGITVEDTKGKELLKQVAQYFYRM